MTLLQKILCVTLGALVLCVPAFYNGFPFMFPDTNGYIITGFTNEIGYARVWLYGGFIRHISLYESPWLVVIAQGMLITMTLSLAFKHLFTCFNWQKYTLLYILVVGQTTAVAFHVSMLMPDTFTPIVILSLCLLLFGKKMSKSATILSVILFMMATAMHNAHLILNIGLIIGLSLLMLVKKVRLFLKSCGIGYRKIAWLGGLVVITHLLVCTLHYSKGGAFQATRGGQIFLFARLCDFGIAQSYLKENRDIEKLNQLYDNVTSLGLGAHFLWSGESYLYQTGGWTKENEVFYGKLVKNILTTPKYLKKYLIKTMETTLMQFFSYERSPHSELYGVNANVINTYFPTYTLAAKHSRQLKRSYNESSIENRNAIQHGLLMLSMIVILVMLWNSGYSKYQKAIALFILFALLLNAFIAAASSGVFHRYQSRVAWLVTLPAFYFISDKVHNIFTRIKE